MNALSFRRRGESNTVLVGVRLPRALRERLDALADSQQTTLSEVVRVLLEAGMETLERLS